MKIIIYLIISLFVLISNNAQAAGRVFYDDFESQVASDSKWASDLFGGQPRPRCPNVSASVDGVAGPYAGSKMLQCNHASGDVGLTTFETLTLATQSLYANELFIRTRVRVDQDMDRTASSTKKILRFYLQGGGVQHDMFALIRPVGVGNYGLHNESHSQVNVTESTYWGTAPGDNTGATSSWHKVEYYIRQDTGVMKVWHDGVLVRNESGLNYVGVNWGPFFITSNFSDTHDSTNHVYFDEFEVYSDSGNGATGYMSDATIQAGPDTTRPTITSVTSTDGYYNLGDQINITVNFSEPVTSTGNVTVTLETGANDRTCAFTVSNALFGTCTYTVQSGDTSSDLTVNTIGGVINDQASPPNLMNVFTIGANLAASSNIVIDTTTPTNQNTVFSSNQTITGGQSVTIVSSGETNGYVWFAPAGTTVFTQGSTMTRAGGTATSIIAPNSIGTFKLYVIDAAGNASTASTATLTVNGIATYNTPTIDPSTPATIKSSATSFTTTSFTAPIGSEIFVLYMSYDHATSVTNTGNALTFTQQQNYGNPTQDAVTMLWTAPVTTSSARTITVNMPRAIAAMVKVLVMTGVDQNSPIGATGGSINNTGIASGSYNSSLNNSLGWALFSDWYAQGAPTPGTGVTLYDSYDLPSPADDVTYAILKRTAVTPTAGTSVTLNTTAPTSGAKITFSYFEMIPSVGGADTTPPVISATSPSGTLSAGTTSTLLQVTTADELATCKYGSSTEGTTTNTNYASLPHIFSSDTTPQTTHSTSVSGLSNGNTYTYYVRCIDQVGNSNTTSTIITFSIASASTITGLDFPGSSGTTMRFMFSDPHLNGLPIWGPSGQGVTYIWKAYPRQQHGYYTTFFWGNNGNFWWDGGNPNTVYGFHPYPQADGNSHVWEAAVGPGLDILGGAVVYDRWYTQVVRVWSDGSGKHHEFYYDWPDQAKIITYTASTSFGNTDPPTPALTWGDAPWPASSGNYGPSGQGNEIYNGILRGFQIYNNLLSLTDVQTEINSPLSSSAGATNIWYLNTNPTPTDISDKSSKGHNPAWVGSARPTLYTLETGDTTAPTILTKTISSNGTTLTLSLDESVNVGTGGNAGFSITRSSAVATTVTFSSGASGTSSLIYTINPSIKAGETVTLTYTQPNNGIEDLSGNDLASFTNTAVTNSSTQQYTVTGTAGSNGTVSPASRSVSYNGTTTFSITPATGYSVTVTGGTCGGSFVAPTYTTNAITANCTVTGTFADITAPTAPTLTATPASTTQINLSWSGATDGVGIIGYDIQRCTGVNCTNWDTNIPSPGTGTTYNNTGLTQNTTYGYHIRAYDAANNYGVYSTTAYATTTITYTVTSSAGSNGSISPLGTQQVLNGNTANFTITATNGYTPSVATGTDNCGGTLTGGTYPTYTYVTNAISASCYVRVTFSDTIAPTVSITEPTAGLVLSGNQPVSATATDAVGIIGVQFKLDNTNLSTEDTTSPYSISWNTTTTNEGSHTLTATARDAAGNNTISPPISITVNNTAPFIINLACGDNATINLGSTNPSCKNTLAKNNTSALLTLTLNKSGQCKFSMIPNSNYTTRTETPTSLDTFHSKIITVNSGGIYHYYTYCKDSANNIMPNYAEYHLTVNAKPQYRVQP